jgi:membrane protein YdbS with pleckstrin-like domain
MADVFAAPGGAEWVRVSPALARMRRALVGAAALPVLVVAGLVAGASPVAAAALAAAGFVVLVGGWTAAGRNQRSWGYLERDDDLVITHGALFRSLTVVPYGRMQLVDVAAGPVERAFGIVHVKLHTAAATTDAQVCGLTPDVADRLRDRLTERGEARASGL